VRAGDFRVFFFELSLMMRFPEFMRGDFREANMSVEFHLFVQRLCDLPLLKGQFSHAAGSPMNRALSFALSECLLPSIQRTDDCGKRNHRERLRLL